MNGKAHAAASTFLAVPTGIGVAYATASLGLGTCAALGTLSGVILSPDLDQEQRTESEAAVYRMGSIIGFVFQVAFYSYGLLIPHRHWSSHLPIIGTVGRLAYLQLLILIVQFTLKNIGLPFDPFFWTIYPRVVLAWIIGLAVSDIAHWCMDGFPI